MQYHLLNRDNHDIFIKLTHKPTPLLHVKNLKGKYFLLNSAL